MVIAKVYGYPALQSPWPSSPDETKPDQTPGGDNATRLPGGKRANRAPGDRGKLNPQEMEELRRLQAEDQQVRAHEAAHLAAAGGLASGAPSYTYVKGPDGLWYATGGEVQIVIPDGATPAEELRLAAQALRAALAPASPSGQDQAVASWAAQRMAQAQMELMQQRIALIGSKAGSAEGKGQISAAAVTAYQIAQHPGVPAGILLNMVA